MNISRDFNKSINGFPPCKAIIKRIEQFDTTTYTITTKTPQNFIHNTSQLTTVKSQPPNCSTSWAIAPTTCLSDIWGLSTSINPELDDMFMLSCYNPSRISKYYVKQGCEGDSVYNAMFFLQTNGTIINICWNSETENFDSEKIPQCSRMSLKCPDPKLYKISKIENISPILTLQGLVKPNQEPINIQQAQEFIKSHVKKQPVVASFIVQESFCLSDSDILSRGSSEWNTEISRATKDSIYRSNKNSPIVGYHCAVIVGWGIGKISGEEVPYWILRNSWGSQWRKFYPDLPGGYWKHAMYPWNEVSCPDISIHSTVIPVLPWEDKKVPLGGVIVIDRVKENKILNMKEIENAPYIKTREVYPEWMWVVMFVVLVIYFCESVEYH